MPEREIKTDFSEPTKGVVEVRRIETSREVFTSLEEAKKAKGNERNRNYGLGAVEIVAGLPFGWLAVDLLINVYNVYNQQVESTSSTSMLLATIAGGAAIALEYDGVKRVLEGEESAKVQESIDKRIRTFFPPIHTPKDQ